MSVYEREKYVDVYLFSRIQWIHRYPAQHHQHRIHWFHRRYSRANKCQVSAENANIFHKDMKRLEHSEGWYAIPLSLGKSHSGRQLFIVESSIHSCSNEFKPSTFLNAEQLPPIWRSLRDERLEILLKLGASVRFEAGQILSWSQAIGSFDGEILQPSPIPR